jgi:hypothetical protein
MGYGRYHVSSSERSNQDSLPLLVGKLVDDRLES